MSSDKQDIPQNPEPPTLTVLADDRTTAVRVESIIQNRDIAQYIGILAAACTKENPSSGIQQIQLDGNKIKEAYQATYNYYFAYLDGNICLKPRNYTEFDIKAILIFLKFCPNWGIIFEGLNIRVLNNLILNQNDCSKMDPNNGYRLYMRPTVYGNDFIRNMESIIEIKKENHRCNIKIKKDSTITKDQIISYLLVNGVVFGINSKKIDEAINNTGTYITVAESLKAKDGESEALEEVRVLGINPSIVHGKGLTNTTNPLPIVKKGDLLYKIVPSKKGVPGMTIFGISLPAKEGKKFNKETNLGQGVGIIFENEYYYIVATEDGIINALDPKPRTTTNTTSIDDIKNFKISVYQDKYANGLPLSTTGSIVAKYVDIVDFVKYENETTSDYYIACRSYRNDTSGNINFEISSGLGITIPNSVINSAKLLANIGDIVFQSNVSGIIRAKNGTVKYETSSNGTVLGNKVVISGSASNSYIFGNTIDLGNTSIYKSCVFYVTTPQEAIKLSNHSSISNPDQNNTIVYLRGIKFEDTLEDCNKELGQKMLSKQGLDAVIADLDSKNNDSSDKRHELTILELEIMELKKTISNIKDLNYTNGNEEMLNGLPIRIKIVEFPKGATHLGDLTEEQITNLKSSPIIHF